MAVINRYKKKKTDKEERCLLLEESWEAKRRKARLAVKTLWKKTPS
ncbi:hypothetical protein [Lentibacillus sp. CBA3610]|nr:hypothetical protein [Lentibacillus sp. CBA3610]